MLPCNADRPVTDIYVHAAAAAAAVVSSAEEYVDPGSRNIIS